MPNEHAVRRRLDKQICMRCNARHSNRATRCRKCGYGSLRPKSVEGRGA